MQSDTNVVPFRGRPARTPAQKRAAQREREHRQIVRGIARRMIPWLRQLKAGNPYPAFILFGMAAEARELSRELVAIARDVERQADA
jgi:hypothetical protein